MLWSWWPDYNDAWNVLYPTTSCDAWGSKGANGGFYCNEEVDALLDEAKDASTLEAYEEHPRRGADDHHRAGRARHLLVAAEVADRAASEHRRIRLQPHQPRHVRLLDAVPEGVAGLLAERDAAVPIQGRPRAVGIVIGQLTLPVRPVLRLRSPAPRPRPLARSGSRFRVRRSRRVPPPRGCRFVGGWLGRGRISAAGSAAASSVAAAGDGGRNARVSTPPAPPSSRETKVPVPK